jgi:hypothetical protein
MEKSGLFKGHRNKSKAIETTTFFRVIDATLSHDVSGAGAREGIGQFIITGKIELRVWEIGIVNVDQLWRRPRANKGGGGPSG